MFLFDVQFVLGIGQENILSHCSCRLMQGIVIWERESAKLWLGWCARVASQVCYYQLFVACSQPAKSRDYLLHRQDYY